MKKKFLRKINLETLARLHPAWIIICTLIWAPAGVYFMYTGQLEVHSLPQRFLELVSTVPGIVLYVVMLLPTLLGFFAAKKLAAKSKTDFCKL